MEPCKTTIKRRQVKTHAVNTAKIVGLPSASFLCWLDMFFSDGTSYIWIYHASVICFHCWGSFLQCISNGTNLASIFVPAQGWSWKRGKLLCPRGKAKIWNWDCANIWIGWPFATQRKPKGLKLWELRVFLVLCFDCLFLAQEPFYKQDGSWTTCWIIIFSFVFLLTSTNACNINWGKCKVAWRLLFSVCFF